MNKIKNKIYAIMNLNAKKSELARLIKNSKPLCLMAIKIKGGSLSISSLLQSRQKKE
jgi:hypothetical protein